MENISIWIFADRAALQSRSDVVMRMGAVESNPAAPLDCRNFAMYFGEALAPRDIRHVAEHKKLLTKANQIALIHPWVVRHSTDYSIRGLQAKSGFTDHDLVGVQVWTAKGHFTVLLVPLRLWYRPLWKRRAIELKNFLRSNGKRCIIAPASYLDRQPRLQNARLVAASRNAPVSATDRIALLSKIDEATGLTLGEASSLINTSKDPAAAVLHLVAERSLAIDSDRAIGPHSVLSMRYQG